MQLGFAKRSVRNHLLIVSSAPDRPWGSMSDEGPLRSARLYRKDRRTGEEGYTLASVLLLERRSASRAYVLPARSTLSQGSKTRRGTTTGRHSQAISSVRTMSSCYLQTRIYKVDSLLLTASAPAHTTVQVVALVFDKREAAQLLAYVQVQDMQYARGHPFGKRNAADHYRFASGHDLERRGMLRLSRVRTIKWGASQAVLRGNHGRGRCCAR